MDVAVNVLNASSLIQAFGTLGVFVVLFAETGLFVGFFLPGDSLLFTAGFIAAGHVAKVHLSLGPLIPAAAAGAILGAQTGFVIGRGAGAALFSRPDSRFFKRRYVERAEEYFDRFGAGKAVVLARFVPIVRTFLNPVVGASRMPTRDFTVWNIVGGLAWTIGLLLLGYYLGTVSFLRGHIEALVLGVVILSLVPILIEAVRRRPIRRAS